MNCPFCRQADTRVVDSRTAEDGAAIRRRRWCGECGRRFTTVEAASLSVVKRSGATEPFSRDKVLVGVRKACQGRPVSHDDLAVLVHRVEEAVRATGCAEIPADEVGLAILGPLRELDEVAYLRFASVYRRFDSLEDFESEIAVLRAERLLVAEEPAQVEGALVAEEPAPLSVEAELGVEGTAPLPVGGALDAEEPASAGRQAVGLDAADG